MPQRDYMARKNKKKAIIDTRTKKILVIISAILLLFLIGLWALKSNAPVSSTIPVPATNSHQPKSELPSRPEETWSYIRDLETRTVITDDTQRLQEQQARLTAQQKLQAEEKRRQEEERLKKQAEAELTPEKVLSQPSESEFEQSVLTEEQLLAQKQAEQKRQQEAKKAEQARLAAEKAKAEQAKQPKIVATTAKPKEKATNQAGKFGLQCGAFKNKAQAENMQARLAMAGFNARIVSNADWNRVFVGPIGDRSATSRAQSNARSVAECVIVAM